MANLDPKPKAKTPFEVVKFNDSGWLNYPEDYDDEGLQTYFDEPIVKVRFWNSKPSEVINGKWEQDSYDVVLLSELSKEEREKYLLDKHLLKLPIMTIREKRALTLILDYLKEELEEVKAYYESGEEETHIGKSVKILINYLGVQK